MSQASKRCKFKSTITRWECLHEVLEDSKEGFCIFHERKTDKDGEKFNEGIKRITEDRSLDAFYFEGFFFPSSIDFSKVEFKKSVFFDDAEFWGREASFRETKFFGQKTSFWNAKFGAGKTSVTPSSREKLALWTLASAETKQASAEQNSPAKGASSWTRDS
jgi:hypothetical protein